MVWIIWLWVFPEPSRGGDAGTVLLSFLVVAAAIFGSVATVNAGTAQGAFNQTPQAFSWSLGGVLILMLGLGLLFVVKPASWGTGLAVFFLALTGFILDLLHPAGEGDFSGLIRFFMLASFPLLLTLSTRFNFHEWNFPEREPVEAAQKSVELQSAQSESQAKEIVRERRRYSTDPKTLQSLLALAAQTDPVKTDQYIVRSVAQALLVDLCYLIYISDDKNSLDIATGYDLIREEILEGGKMNRDAVPMLTNAILRGRPLRLPASTTSSDLKGLGDILNLPNPGNLLNVPIQSEKGTIGSFLLLSPYSNRVWNADDQTFLTNIASSFVPIVERSRGISPAEPGFRMAVAANSHASEQLVQLKTINNDLVEQVEELKNQLQQVVAEAALQKDLASLASQPDKDSEGLPGKDSLVVKASPNGSKSQLEIELKQTLAEMAHLQNQLSESNEKLMVLEIKASSAMSSEQAEVIASISQELRQPMSSVIGYADLLLGESVGILGALQRKFIERIRTSTERIGSLVDDLIQITTIEAGNMAMKAELVDLNLIIDNAMAYTSSQLREKNITLRIDIPEDLKPMHADRDALQQILIHLLQNAGSASPVEGTVTLRVRMQEEGGNEHVTIQVTDTGGGIPREDMPRVFSRLYRAENVLIQGVGDTGVGLSIAKALTDAQGGRIWVDTETGSGSTFSVSLPVKSSIPGEEPQEV
jgi:signal transduction histidine kinase